MEGVLELNEVRDCVISMLSKCHFMSEDQTFTVRGVIDASLLMVTDGNVENLVHEIDRLRNDFLQLLCLENLYKEDTDKEDKPFNTINDNQIFSHDKVKSFQGKEWFYFANGM